MWGELSSEWGELSSQCGRVVFGRVSFGASCLGASCLWGELSVIHNLSIIIISVLPIKTFHSARSESARYSKHLLKMALEKEK